MSSLIDSSEQGIYTVNHLIGEVVQSYADFEENSWSVKSDSIDIEESNIGHEIGDFIHRNAPRDHRFTGALAQYLSGRITEDIVVYARGSDTIWELDPQYDDRSILDGYNIDKIPAIEF